ncbi:MAG TPA: LPS export ABC transporter ATP-binding protein [Thermoanaerobaculia bacterium]|nr:LPS export ABC transporter ATP-binding protein [Thermoanaerobaculia bacterium]HUM29962.1 LPS export ABC transporter ATP-binding protein [Thermoanaerobaculia bacterium]HXK68171.1 LPS export ABC transporter ATP-binding protein [Thermoanaerobaculia bacterium]
MSPSHRLSIRNLSKRYGSRRVVKGIDMDLLSGEVVGLLGPNGAGKTTTFHMIVGFVPPNGGEVHLDDSDITDSTMYMRAKHGIVYLPQESSIFRRMTVMDNLLCVLEQQKRPPKEQMEVARDLLKELGVLHLADQRADRLSGGERRRVEIARALTLTPSFLLLDEPFAGVDPLAVLDVQRVVNHLKSAGIGILITDHNVRETLKITDRAYIIKDGEIFRSGTPMELSDDPQVRQAYLGETFSLH